MCIYLNKCMCFKLGFLKTLSDPYTGHKGQLSKLGFELLACTSVKYIVRAYGNLARGKSGLPAHIFSVLSKAK